MADTQAACGSFAGTKGDVDNDNIILNPNFDNGIDNWSGKGCNILVHDSLGGGKIQPQIGKYFASATNRTQNSNGIQQDLTGRMQRKHLYEATAVVRLFGSDVTPSDVRATLYVRTSNGKDQYIGIANLQVSDKDWVQLQGKFLINGTVSKAIIYIEGPPPTTDLLVNSLVVKHAEKPSPAPAPDFSNIEGDVDNENIILNPNFDNGLDNWTGRGCTIQVHDSLEDGKVIPQNGKYFIATTNRTQTWNGIQQDITNRIQKRILYAVTAVVRLFGSGVAPSDVSVTLWTQDSNGKEQYIAIAKLQASDKDWVQIQGQFQLSGTISKAVIFIEGPPPSIDILLNSLVVKHAKKTPPAPAPDFSNVVYGVNVLQNDNLADGLNPWNTLGNCTITVVDGSPLFVPFMARESLDLHEPLDGKCVLVTNRSQAWMGPQQDISSKIIPYVTYQVSGWVRIGSAQNGPQVINVTFIVDNQWINGGQVQVSDERWYEIGSSFRVEQQPSKVMVVVQGPTAGVDLMVAGLQIIPVDRKARIKHLKHQTDKVRKRDVVLKFSGDSLVGASVRVSQTHNSFPIGTCINRSDIDSEEFVSFFVKNFNWAVFGNELKWYWTEPQQGVINYNDADTLLDLCNKNNVLVRGHCIFWEVQNTVQSWIQALSTTDLTKAVQNRINSLLNKYKGKFQHYDVNNEMMHGSFYQDRLGKDIRANMFKMASQLDPSPTLFVNDYSIEDGHDAHACAEAYTQHILGLQEQGAPVSGIGIQGHISNPVGTVVSATLDKLGVLGLPIWFTELDVVSDNEFVRADDLEVMLREAFAHPAVEGIILWGFWEMSMWRKNAHLVNSEWDVNEAGKRFLKLKKEWLSHARGSVDDKGQFSFRGYQGSYRVEVDTTSEKKLIQQFTIDKGTSPLMVNISLGN